MPFQETVIIKCKHSLKIIILFIFYKSVILIFRYVQDLVTREKSLLKKLILQRGGYFYVSGNSKNMPKAVRESLEEALEDKDYVADMLKCGRYQEETWS